MVCFPCTAARDHAPFIPGSEDESQLDLEGPRSHKMSSAKGKAEITHYLYD